MFYLSLFLLAVVAMAIVLVIICVHRCSILSFRSKVVVVPFFLSLSSTLCSVSFSSSSVRSFFLLRRILKWYHYYSYDDYCCCSRAVRRSFFFRERIAVFSFLSLFCVSLSRNNAFFLMNNNSKRKEDDRKT
jgi:hypothetical protein